MVRACFLLPVFAASLLFVSVPPAIGATNGCLEHKSPTKQLNCLVTESKAADDVEVCLEADRSELRWMCVARFAEFKNDTAICDTVSSVNDTPAYASLDQCRTHMAITFGRVELCATIYNGTLADTCYYGVVKISGAGAELCEMIRMPEFKAVCLSAPTE